jgi:putative oxidoreductase
VYSGRRNRPGDHDLAGSADAAKPCAGAGYATEVTMNRERMNDVGLLLLRLCGLFLAVGHGWGKVSALAAGHAGGFIAGVDELGFPQPGLFAWAAALSEFVGGLCVAFGVGTRVAAAFAAFTMAVAAFLRHHALQHLLVAVGAIRVSEETRRSWGNPEAALVFLLVFTTLVLAGGGRFALERIRRRR